MESVLSLIPQRSATITMLRDPALIASVRRPVALRNQCDPGT